MKTYPLLQSQLGVFYDCLKYPQVKQYNIPCIVPLTGDIDTERLEMALLPTSCSRRRSAMCWQDYCARRRWHTPPSTMAVATSVCVMPTACLCAPSRL